MIHQGYSTYLPYTLAQAKSTNPQSDIFLLGDRGNVFLKFIQHRDIANYAKDASRFDQIYRKQHQSPNSYEYELICFQRWFILKEFMEAHQFLVCFHMDSDVMLYGNMTQEFQRIQRKHSGVEFTIHNRGMGHNSFVTLSGIRKFCQLVMDTYTDPDLFRVIEEQQAKWRAERAHLPIEIVGGISDMSLLRQFYLLYLDCIVSTNEIIDDSTFDFKMDSPSGGYEVENGLKKIHWIKRQPFCKNVEVDRLIRFNSLHFQGGSKRYIHQYFTGNLLTAFYYKLKARILWKLKLI
jgi:hypothetical protein